MLISSSSSKEQSQVIPSSQGPPPPPPPVAFFYLEETLIDKEELKEDRPKDLGDDEGREEDDSAKFSVGWAYSKYCNEKNQKNIL